MMVDVYYWRVLLDGGPGGLKVMIGMIYADRSIPSVK